MNAFVSGAFTMASAAVALFFLRFWRRSHDRLFAILSAAFALLAVERTVLAFVRLEHEGRHWIYVARLFAFILIIVGVLDKNRPRKNQP
jgi:predicted membrane-bound spermidine synthase